MPSKSQFLWMYEVMEKARYYEDTIAAVYMEGKQPKFDIGAGPLPGEMHLAAGQEPCAAGVCIHLRADDTVTATHRPHHAAIAKGVDLKKMTAEIFGKKAGLAGGRGGHMHLLDPAVNFVCSGIIAQGAGPAVGAALAAKHGTAAQLRAIRKAHADLLREARRHHNPLDADRGFHVAIAQATGNSALELVVQTLWDQRVGPLYRALESKLEYPAMAAETIGEHEAVLVAIMARDPAAARGAMRRHMDMTRKRYIRDWKEAGK